MRVRKAERELVVGRERVVVPELSRVRVVRVVQVVRSVED